MKKSIAFIGALFMGSIAFAQVSKNDNTNKTASRKVLDADVKDLPQDPDANAKKGEIKGEYHQKIKGEYYQKIKGEESNYLKVTDNTSSKMKGSGITQKGNASKSAADPYLKVSSEKKSSTSDNSAIKGSGAQSQNATSDIHLKVTEIKGEKEK